MKWNLLMRAKILLLVFFQDKESDLMFNRIIKYERYKDYYSLNSMEVKISLLLSIAFSTMAFYFLDIYNKFAFFESAIIDLLSYVIAGEFGLIGMALAGMAIITSLITPDIMAVIQKNDHNDVTGRLLSQFEFSAFNFAVQISYIIFLWICIHSDKKIVSPLFFYIIFIILIYHFFFNLFYTLALIGNCIKFFEIKNKCYKLIQTDKSKIDIANEIRIDFLLSIILKDKGFDNGMFIEHLDEIVDKSKILEKEELKRYFHSYYNIK